MKLAGKNLATHLSLIWGITLAVLSLMEWHGLERDPVRREILSPFIERTMEVTVEESTPPADTAATSEPDAVLRYEVELKFNGRLFLVFFFGPILVFQAAGFLWSRFQGD